MSEVREQGSKIRDQGDFLLVGLPECGLIPKEVGQFSDIELYGEHGYANTNTTNFGTGQ